MNRVDKICWNVKGGVKRKCFMCRGKVIVNCFWERKKIEGVLREEVWGFVCGVWGEKKKGVKVKVVIVVFDLGKFMKGVLVNKCDKVEGVC